MLVVTTATAGAVTVVHLATKNRLNHRRSRIARGDSTFSRRCNYGDYDDDTIFDEIRRLTLLTSLISYSPKV